MASACALLVACALAAGVLERPAEGASSNVTVTFNIASMTSISLAGCPAGARTLGTVLPGVPAVTSTDCTVQFGSSNDTSRLRLLQSDNSNTAMFAWTVGTKDTGFNAAPAGVRQVAPPGGGFGANPQWHGSGMLDVAVDGDVLKGGDVADTFTVGRWSAAGALETATWGGGDGYASVDVAVDDVAMTDNRPGNLQLLRSGKVVVAGVGQTAGNDKVAVARFDAAGVIDGSFGGGDGVVSFVVPGANGARSASALEIPDGSLLVSGTTDLDAYYVAKLTTAGVLDTGFGGGDGIWSTPAAATTAGGTTILLDDGRFLYVAAADGRPWIARFTRAGELDTTFAAGAGWSSPAIGTRNGAQSGGFVDATGNIYVLGDNQLGCSHVAITRYTSAGAADTAWAAGDATITHTAIGASWECADFGSNVQLGDGRFCFGGDHFTTTARYWIGCFLPDGSFDPTFGSSGLVEFAGPTGIESAGGGLAGANGRIYAGGGSGDLTIMALGSDAQTIPDYAHPGTNFASAGGAFGACLRTSASATPTWPTAPGLDCSADGAHWRGIARLGTDATAEIATAAAAVTTATASLRFGARAGGTAKGSFLAPLTFEVLAP